MVAGVRRIGFGRAGSEVQDGRAAFQRPHRKQRYAINLSLSLSPLPLDSPASAPAVARLRPPPTPLPRPCPPVALPIADAHTASLTLRPETLSLSNSPRLSLCLPPHID
ncbi:uncharacterized protein PSANT_05790 [Moesziomyces antarcticus]|uniref:Uncharacterized protein n=1 Tax=Pseudozyma antarctica TaxID=84753 RepID=A0A5C3FUX4_PSEA2|nr:uncharacterized protein PSANT_05790 [Moesziomyces antarcticus]